MGGESIKRRYQTAVSEVQTEVQQQASTDCEKDNGTHSYALLTTLWCTISFRQVEESSPKGMSSQIDLLQIVHKLSVYYTRLTIAHPHSTFQPSQVEVRCGC